MSVCARAGITTTELPFFLFLPKNPTKSLKHSRASPSFDPTVTATNSHVTERSLTDATRRFRALRTCILLTDPLRHILKHRHMSGKGGTMLRRMRLRAVGDPSQRVRAHRNGPGFHKRRPLLSDRRGRFLCHIAGLRLRAGVKLLCQRTCDTGAHHRRLKSMRIPGGEAGHRRTGIGIGIGIGIDIENVAGNGSGNGNGSVIGSESHGGKCRRIWVPGDPERESGRGIGIGIGNGSESILGEDPEVGGTDGPGGLRLRMGPVAGGWWRGWGYRVGIGSCSEVCS